MVLHHFLYALRAAGLNVGISEWLTLIEALSRGYDRAHLPTFYVLARALLIKRESDYDRYDQCFAQVFEGVEGTLSIHDELLRWLAEPIDARMLTDAERARIEGLDLDALRAEFEKRLREQKERHDGGNHFVGTGGTSPFGHGGYHPSGVRVGGVGVHRSAVQVAHERKFQNLRSDVVIDTRQLGVALRRLRRLGKDGLAATLDIEKSIEQTAKAGGEIELVFSPEKKNRLKLWMLVDVGGSMDPHAALCEKLFSAAHAQNHFARFQAHYFHNCPYETLYDDMWLGQGQSTAALLRQIDESWCVLFVGDAWMSPFELTHASGAISYFQQNAVSGLSWLQRFRQQTSRIAWLNPESMEVWDAPSIQLVRRLFPMFPLTLDGLSAAVDVLRGAKPPSTRA